MYEQNESDKKFVTNLISKSKNIYAEQISKTKLSCNCLICGEEFIVKHFHKIDKISCPICKEKSRMKKQEDKINLCRNAWNDSDATTVHRVCEIYDGCIRRGGNLCESCILKDKPFYTKQELKDIVKNANPSIELITDEYFSGRTVPAKYRCVECGTVSEGFISYLMRGELGCNECNHSIGENKVKSWLIQHGVNFESEKTFDRCKDKRVLRFDFYLPEYNAVIEFDGMQHFVPTAFHSYEDAESNFKGQQKRDRIKNKFCRDNSIAMLRIKYTERDIDAVLTEFLSKFSSTKVHKSEQDDNMAQTQ